MVRDDGHNKGGEWEVRAWARAIDGGEDEGWQGEGRWWW